MLKLCPFCGHQAIESQGSDYVNSQIYCDGCGARFYGGKLIDNELRKKWNRRVYLGEMKHEDIHKLLTKTISGLEYAAFNLTGLKKSEKLPYGITESTCPEETLLIELRDLKEFMKLTR